MAPIFIWTNVGLLSIEPLETNFCEFLTKIQTFWFHKMLWKMLSAKGSLLFRPQYINPDINIDFFFKCIFLNKTVWIFIKISLKFVPKGPIINILELVLIMAWCWPGDKPLSEPMVIILLMPICVTQPQWVKAFQMLMVPTTRNLMAPPTPLWRKCQVISQCHANTFWHCSAIWDHRPYLCWWYSSQVTFQPHQPPYGGNAR